MTAPSPARRHHVSRSRVRLPSTVAGWLKERSNPGPLWRNGLLLVLLAGAAGCTVWEYEMGVPLAAFQKTPASEGAPLAELLDRLGPPLRVSALDSGFVLGWEYWRVHDANLGFSLGAAGADFLSVDFGALNTAGQFLLLTFDKQHRLTGGALGRWENEAGGGAALQPLVGLASTTSVEDLIEGLPHHTWGAAWLERLPRALNTPSRPDMGQSGIQQRGTPVGIGQQTLEMDD